MGTIANFYDSSKEQSILSKAVAFAKYGADNTITGYDTKGKDKAAMDTLIDTITDGSCTRVVVSNPTQATYSAAGLFIYDQLAYLDICLATANKGTSVNAGTCRSNATVTEIILGTGASDQDDTYNGMYIKTAGTTAVYRVITDYVGTTRACTVATTTTAITTTETYIVYQSAYVDVIGDASTNELACHVAWTTLFPNTNPPKLIQIMGGYGTGFKNYAVNNITADSATNTTLTDATVFTADAEIGKWLGIISGTTGGGEIQLITDNTTTYVTVNPFRITPTGTIKYQISDTKEWCLANYFLPYAIKAYLQLDNTVTNKALKKMLDKYDILKRTSAPPNAIGDDELVLSYVAKGQAIHLYASI